MQIILTWSKPQSRQIAAFFREWLKEVVPGVEPWMSEEDLEKGKQWFDSLMGQLGVTSTCIICVTRENVDSPWIHFEAGAIAMKQGQGGVFPYLIGVEPGELAGGPLALFQCTRADRSDTWRLVRDINRSIAKSHTLFWRRWPTCGKPRIGFSPWGR